MMDVEAWLSREGQRLMFIYGTFDPWAARPFELGQARDSFRFFVDGGNHHAGLESLAPGEHAVAMNALERWLGVSVLAQPLEGAPMKRGVPPPP